MIWANQLGGQGRWVGKSVGWVGQVGRKVRWVRNEGQVGLICFGLEGSKFRTVSESVNESVSQWPRWDIAARAAKNIALWVKLC